MSIEKTNQPGVHVADEVDEREVRLNTVEEKMTSFKARLSEVVNLPYEEEPFKSWVEEVLVYEGGDHEIKNFFENISKYPSAKEFFREDITVLPHAFYEMGQKIFDSVVDLEIMLHNLKERHNEIRINEEERRYRIFMNPVASEEEYRLGTYKESIEYQVRDAVFELLRKGYLPFGSGFRDLSLGSQSVGICIEEGVDYQVLIDKLKSLNIPFDIYENRMEIFLYPKDKKLPMEDWKFLWDKFAAMAPPVAGKMKNSDNGLQGQDFREAQDSIKRGENAWLRSGLAFVDGKVVEMTYHDFKKLQSH